MGVLDIIIVCCFLPSLYFGAKNGLVKQIVSILFLFFGMSLAIKCSHTFSGYIQGFIQMDEKWIKVLSFIIIFAAVAIVLSLIGKLIEKIIKVTLLGWLNRLLGIVMALAKTALILSLAIYFLDSLNELLGIIPEEKIAESNFYEPMLGFARTVFPALKEFFTPGA